MSEELERIQCLIIGSGPAGYTAAIYAARADLKPVVYTGMKPGGQLTDTTEVDNFPGYPDGTQGPEMMVDMQKQAERFGTDVRFGYATKCEFDANGGVHRVEIDGNKMILADTVIISTGATAKWLGLESEERLNGFGVSACAVCDGFFYKGQEVVVVGAGDTAAEEATYLAKLCTKVTMLVRKDHMRASKAMQHRVENTANIKVLFNTETEEIISTNFQTYLISTYPSSRGKYLQFRHSSKRISAKDLKALQVLNILKRYYLPSCNHSCARITA